MICINPIIILSFTSLLLFSCNNNKNAGNAFAEEKNDGLNQFFKTDTSIILKDYQTWYNYFYYNTPLSQDFIALNTDSIQIDKITFLHYLLQGNIIPLKVKLVNGTPVYKLIKLNSENKNIASTINQLATAEMKYYKMEGIPIPAFNFTDLQGASYDATNTKGKIVVLKCWFIRCVACIKEFPDCNKLVKEYAGRDDILFVSLATDKKKDLDIFLQKEPLAYATVPEAETYISDKLDINAYPTHLLIDKNGIIKKVVTSIDELKPFLEKLAKE